MAGDVPFEKAGSGMIAQAQSSSVRAGTTAYAATFSVKEVSRQVPTSSASVGTTQSLTLSQKLQGYRMVSRY
jgi:hypothetical protein